MEENRKECTVFEGERIALAPPRRRGIYVRLRTVVLVCALIVAIAFVCARNGIFDDLPLGGGVANGADTDSENDPESDEAEASDTSTKETPDTEMIGDESESEREESTVESTEATEEGGVISLDLSEVERGSSYIVNYTGQSLDAEGIFEMGFAGGRYSYTERPVVMIIHTHTSEKYYDFSSDDPLQAVTKSVVAVGERIAYALNLNGVPTVHCTVIHDGEGEPYENAARTIATMLDIYPSIEYVIDIHRMNEIDGNGALVRTESGGGSAQIRLTVSSEGILTRDSLALAMHLRAKLNRDGKRLCMPVVFTDSEYNSRLSAYYLKVDVGAAGNSAEEALLAGDSLADALVGLLKK